MLPQHEYSWGDRHPLSAVRDLPSRQVRPPAAERPRIDTNCVSGHMLKAPLAETRVPPVAYRNAHIAVEQTSRPLCPRRASP